MRALAVTPSLPGIPPIKTYAAFPVWKDSTRKDVRFLPMAKREAVKLFHEARRFERRTRKFRKQDGAIGRNGLAILHAMIFDCLNFSSGRCDPSYATIAQLANISVRSVARGLQKLKSMGVISWLRRCSESIVGGRWHLEQESNAYALRPPSQWLGYRVPPEPPAPIGLCGEHPPLPSGLDMAAAAARAGDGARGIAKGLALDADDPLAGALLSLSKRLF